MKVKMLEKVFAFGKGFEEDEIRVVSAEQGAHLVDMGWAEHVPGDGEQQRPTGERDLRPRAIKVADQVIHTRSQ